MRYETCFRTVEPTILRSNRSHNNDYGMGVTTHRPAENIRYFVGMCTLQVWLRLAVVKIWVAS